MENQEFLSFLLRALQNNQMKIRCILNQSMCKHLRSTLELQLREYDSLETDVWIMAHRRGWELQELDPIRSFLSDRLMRLMLSGGKSDSRIADIMIQNNTRSIIRNLKNLHRLNMSDPGLRILSQKLQDCETSGIQLLQAYL